MQRITKTSSSKPQDPAAQRLWWFGVSLWSSVGLISALGSWPFGVALVLLATCLHFAALDGPIEPEREDGQLHAQYVGTGIGEQKVR